MVDNVRTLNSTNLGPDPLSYDYKDTTSILSRFGNLKRWADLRYIEKILVGIIGLVSVVSIALIITVAVMGSKLNRVEESIVLYQGSSSKYCLLTDCALTAGDILRPMDFSADPCKDFYQFSCGNWENEFPIPESKSVWDQSDYLKNRITRELHTILQQDHDHELDPQPIQMAQKFYDDCVKYENVNNYSALHHFVGHLMSDDHPRDLATTLGHIRRALGGNFIFNLEVELDERNPSRNAIYIDQPSLGIPRSHLISKKGHHEDHNYADVYEVLVENTWKKVFQDKREKEVARNVIQFERLLAEISTDPEDRRNASEYYNSFTVAQLYSLTDAEGFRFNWDSYFEEVFFEIYDPAKNRSSWNKTNVIVRDVHFLHMLETVLKGNKTQIIDDFLKWRIILTLISDVSNELAGLKFEFNEKSQGNINTAPPLWKICVEKVEEHFGMALSYHFLQDNLAEEYKKEVTDLFEEIKDTLKKSLNSDRDLDWMSHETKKKAVLKLDKMQAFIAYPEWILSGHNHTINKSLLTTELMSYYYHLTLDEDNDHFDNMVEILEWKSKEDLKEINKLVDRSSDAKWLVDPIDVTPFYWATHNSITIPAGVLQSPFYDSPVHYLNYGALGSLISHLLIHSFDQKGRQNGPDGSLAYWWDAETEKNYANKAECYKNDFKNYSVEGQDIEIHWKESRVQESIADNLGLKLAFKAYQSYIEKVGILEEPLLPGFNETPHQLFFLAYAQMWCSGYRTEYINSNNGYSHHGFTPTQFRAKGGLHDSVEFAKAWSCPMPASDRNCDIW